MPNNAQRARPAPPPPAAQRALPPQSYSSPGLARALPPQSYSSPGPSRALPPQSYSSPGPSRALPPQSYVLPTRVGALAPSSSSYGGITRDGGLYDGNFGPNGTRGQYYESAAPSSTGGMPLDPWYIPPAPPKNDPWYIPPAPPKKPHRGGRTHRRNMRKRSTRRRR